ncbi:predicted protein [Sclerotinia sclerotiorum 1980 UF-70]|uniref:Uncharacterized protein n=1 Tax=Sclerotinia sclerotiorum (strain ATCC 18683 / 1980 / Ss-1) TaxID=665079 RepID=A7F5J0_SCLS1|nr:predicted protein [Sclerotinia sclerotiorum 1980 UF-70]EDN98011.1 predicted protein [Sclerotinia sclerotiorum 1980 UF-70]
MDIRGSSSMCAEVCMVFGWIIAVMLISGADSCIVETLMEESSWCLEIK